MSYGGQSLTHA